AVVVTDADGDSAPAGNLTINIIDDVPTAHADTGNVNEGSLLTVTAAAGVLANDISGADGYAVGGGVVGVRAAGLDTTTSVLTGAGTNIAGQHGTLHLNTDGSYTYQSTANDITSNTTDVFVYTIKDGDGDLSTTTLTINLTDSGLSASNEDATVNEAALATGSNPTSTAETVTGTLADNVSGGTGPYSFVLVGSPTGSHGTLTLNPDGTYSYTLTTPVHGPATQGTDTVNNVETFTYQATDNHGNTITNTITIDVVDDVPLIGLSGTPVSLTVDETVLTSDATASFAAAFTSAYGADGAGAVTYALGVSASGADSGLVDTATGNHVFLFLESGQVVGREGTNSGTAAGGPIVFTATVSGANVTLDQVRAVVHPDTNNADDNKTLSAANLVTLTATVTDGDGDHQAATLNIGQSLNFHDDGPSISANATTQPVLTVDETNLATDATANFAANFTSAFGSDGAGTVVYGLTATAGP
uniref:DUF5801 repeats-in-toxin domain-containing protein n=1 Tax=Rhizobium loti TaxID=381 RepID=UPI00053B0C94